MATLIPGLVQLIGSQEVVMTLTASITASAGNGTVFSCNIQPNTGVAASQTVQVPSTQRWDLLQPYNMGTSNGFDAQIQVVVGGVSQYQNATLSGTVISTYHMVSWTYSIPLMPTQFFQVNLVQTSPASAAYTQTFYIKTLVTAV